MLPYAAHEHRLSVFSSVGIWVWEYVSKVNDYLLILFFRRMSGLLTMFCMPFIGFFRRLYLNITVGNPKISVVIPVYNAESTIKRCVGSVLPQTFINFECMLIDDGISDKSVEICDEYAAKDSGIRVFYKGNGGVGSRDIFA